MSDTKVKRTRKPRQPKDTAKVIESLKNFTYVQKKEVLTALNEALAEQAAKMKEEAEATLKLING